MIRSLALATIAAISATLPAAQSPVQSPARQVPRLVGTARTQSAVPDALFAAAAGSGGMAEVNVSKIGLQRATDPELKQFSQRMIDDHTKMNQELVNSSRRKEYVFPWG